MSAYNPDGWVIVKIGGVSPHYRVFASWGGGYLNGDSWKLNSGIVDCIYDPYIHCYKFYGHSGSVYVCHKDTYGRITVYNQGVLDNLIEKSDNKAEVMDDRDWTTVSWEFTK